MSLSVNGSADPRLLTDSKLQSHFDSFVTAIQSEVTSPANVRNQTVFNSTSISTLLHDFIQFQNEHLGPNNKSISASNPVRIPSNCLRPFKSLNDPNSPPEANHESPIFTTLISLYSFLRDHNQTVFDVKDANRTQLYLDAVAQVTKDLREKGHIKQIVVSPVSPGLYSKAEQENFEKMSKSLGCE